jgi:hypothetical protein
MARFYAHDQQYSPTGPDSFMVLSVQNWISTRVMTAELRAVQKGLEAMMDMDFGNGALLAVGGDDGDGGEGDDA